MMGLLITPQHNEYKWIMKCTYPGVRAVFSPYTLDLVIYTINPLATDSATIPTQMAYNMCVTSVASYIASS